MIRKITIALIYLFTCNQIKAQNAFVKNRYNAFTEKQTIQWAAYGTTSITTPTPLFSKLIIQKIKAHKTKVYQVVDDGSVEENELIPFSKNGVDSFFMNNEDIRIDSNGIEEKIFTLNTLTDDILRNELKVHQILYVENGILKSHITRVSPLIEVKLKSGLRLGKAEFFSTALSNITNNIDLKTESNTNLGTTKTLFTADSLPITQTLKTTFNNNLIETLWSKIESGVVKIYLNNNKKSTTLQQINEGNLMDLPIINIPIFNEVGTLSKTKKLFIPLKPSLFKKVMIIQQWYYNEQKNILTNKIVELTIYLSEKMLQEAELKNENFLRILF